MPTQSQFPRWRAQNSDVAAYSDRQVLDMLRKLQPELKQYTNDKLALILERNASDEYPPFRPIGESTQAQVPAYQPPSLGLYDPGQLATLSQLAQSPDLAPMPSAPTAGPQVQMSSSGRLTIAPEPLVKKPELLSTEQQMARLGQGQGLSQAAPQAAPGYDLSTMDLLGGRTPVATEAIDPRLVGGPSAFEGEGFLENVKRTNPNFMRKLSGWQLVRYNPRFKTFRGVKSEFRDGEPRPGEFVWRTGKTWGEGFIFENATPEEVEAQIAGEVPGELSPILRVTDEYIREINPYLEAALGVALLTYTGVQGVRALSQTVKLSQLQRIIRDMAQRLSKTRPDVFTEGEAAQVAEAYVGNKVSVAGGLGKVKFRDLSALRKTVRSGGKIVFPGEAGPQAKPGKPLGLPTGELPKPRPTPKATTPAPKKPIVTPEPKPAPTPTAARPGENFRQFVEGKGYKWPIKTTHPDYKAIRAEFEGKAAPKAPVAKPKRPVEPRKKPVVTPEPKKGKTHLHRNPSGHWSFVGLVDSRLLYVQQDGSAATEEQLKNTRQVGPRLAGLKTRTWETAEEAIASARELGIEPIVGEMEAATPIMPERPAPTQPKQPIAVPAPEAPPETPPVASPESPQGPDVNYGITGDAKEVEAKLKARDVFLRASKAKKRGDALEAQGYGPIDVQELGRLEVVPGKYKLRKPKTDDPAKALLRATKDDDLEPVQQGVYHAPNGDLIATNGHVLVRIPGVSDKSGRVVDEGGDVIEGEFPNVASAMPKSSEKTGVMGTYNMSDLGDVVLAANKLGRKYIFNVEFETDPALTNEFFMPAVRNIFETFRDLGVERFTVTRYGPESAFELKAKDAEGRDIQALLMPVRVPDTAPAAATNFSIPSVRGSKAKLTKRGKALIRDAGRFEVAGKTGAEKPMKIVGSVERGKGEGSLEEVGAGKAATAEAVMSILEGDITESQGLARGTDYYRSFIEALPDGELRKLKGLVESHSNRTISRYIGSDVSGELRARDKGGKAVEGKEPWEMTREEFKAEYWHEESKEVLGVPSVPVDEILPTTNWMIERLAGRATLANAFGTTETLRWERAFQVANAIRKGKQVPAEVLKDYPELKPKAPTTFEKVEGGRPQGKLVEAQATVPKGKIPVKGAVKQEGQATSDRARGVEVPKVLYHGTDKDFAEFNPRQDERMRFGTHLGTRKAAEAILRDRNITGTILQIEPNIKNPLELPDLEFWKPEDIARELAKRGIEVPAKSFGGGKFYEYSDIIDAIKKAGYDSIRYTNKLEDPGSTSYIIFDKEQGRILPESGRQRMAEAAKRKAKKSLGTGSQEDDARLRQLRKKVKAGRGVTAGDEKSLMILEGRAKADPSKWKAGDGVGYYAGAATSTKPGSQINRGFRVVSVDPKTKTAVVRQVADTGLTATGGDRDRIGDTTVHVANLVRDKKYNAPRGVGAKPEKPSGRKEPWEMTFSEVWSRHLQEETGPINDRIETIEKKLKDIDPFNPGDFGPRRLDIIKLSPRTDKQRKLIAELNKLQKERHSKRSYEVQLAMATKHSKAIEEAIAAGKPISADVLAEHQEYMGLGEKPGPKSEAKKELWEMTREEYRDAILARSQFELVNMPEWLEAHKKGVADALATGRPVPAEVLKDYPDLAKGAKPAAPPGSSSTASVGTGLTDAERAEIRETLPVGEASPLEAPNRTLKPPTETFGIDLMEASRALRATARYKKLRMFTLGMFRPRGARSKIEMQDIRWTTTMAHELGHAVDYRLNGDHFPRSIKARFPGLKLGEMKARAELKRVSEVVRPLPDRMTWKNTKKSHIKYRAKHVELMADLFAMYAHDPAQARKLAPNVTAALETAINNDARVKAAVDMVLHPEEAAPMPSVRPQTLKGKPFEEEEVMDKALSTPDPEARSLVGRMGLETERRYKKEMFRVKTKARQWEKALSEKQLHDVGAMVEGIQNFRFGGTAAEVSARMTPEMRLVLREYRFEQELNRQEVNKLARDAGITEFISYVEDYLAHFYKDHQKIVMFAGKWAKNTPHAKKRVFPTLADAAEAGLEPLTQNVAYLHQKTADLNFKAALTRRFIANLRKLRHTMTNEPLIVPSMDKAGADWVRIEDNALRHVFAHKDENGNLHLWHNFAYVHPSIARPVEVLMGQPFRGNLARAISTINSTGKALNVSFSFFHGFALLESGQADLMRWHNLVRGLVIGPLEARKRGLGFRPYMTWQAGLKMAEKDPLGTADAIGSGFDLGSSASMDYVRAGMDKYLDQAKEVTARIPILNHVTRAIANTQLAFNRALWDNIHVGLKLFSYHTIVAEELARAPVGMSPKEIKETVARHVNNAYGGQEHIKRPVISKTGKKGIKSRQIRIEPLTPKGMQIAHAQFFASDWRYSNLMIAVEGIIEPKNPVTRKLWLRYWRNMVIALGGQVAGLGYLMWRIYGDDDPDYKKKVWENEPGHEWDLDVTPIKRAMPWHDPDDKSRSYVRFGKQARQVLYLITDFPKGLEKYVGGGLAVLPRILFEQVTGHQAGSGFPMPWTEHREDLAGWARVWSRAKATGENFLPFSWSATNFAFSLPQRKGMTRYKAMRYFQEAFEARLNPSLFEKATGRYDAYNKSVDDFNLSVSEALAANGFKPKAIKKIYLSALSYTRHKYLDKYWKAVNRQDDTKMREIRGKLEQLGVNTKALIQSARMRGMMNPNLRLRIP